MSASILSLRLPVPSPEELRPRPFSEQFPRGRLLEIRRHRQGAQMTMAIACLRSAQLAGETTAWVQPAAGSLFPPDLHDSGIDLSSLIVVNVPRTAGAIGLAKSAELLLRSGGFGVVVIDVSEAKLAGDAVWQGRLLGLAREHQSSVILLSQAVGGSLGPLAVTAGSLGPLVSVCLEPRRERVGRGRFAVDANVRKDKSGSLGTLVRDERRGPWGLL